MADVVEGGAPTSFSISAMSSGGADRGDADALLGGQDDSSLIIDESSFPNQGERSVGVARQWSGRLGKVDNCQVAVFGVTSNGRQHVPVDMRLYLPKVWIG